MPSCIECEQGVAQEADSLRVCFIGGGSVARPLQEGARRVDFIGQPPEVVGDIVFAAWPAPPSPCSPFWVPSSCPLKTLALYQRWLSQSFLWIDIYRVIRSCRCRQTCIIDFPFSNARCGELADWLEHACLSSLGLPALSSSFTY